MPVTPLRGRKGDPMANLPQPNTPATDFTLPNGDAQPARLSNYRGKNVVLAFYPADWSPVCTSELALIQETLEDIHGYNAEVLGISVDSRWSHRAWAESQHITFPLLSDFWPHGAVAQQYGVFDERNGFSERALFFIDEVGTIRGVWVAENPDIAPGLNIIFNTLQRLQGERREEAHYA
jgi:peroxiredoxin